MALNPVKRFDSEEVLAKLLNQWIVILGPWFRRQTQSDNPDALPEREIKADLVSVISPLFNHLTAQMSHSLTAGTRGCQRLSLVMRRQTNGLIQWGRQLRWIGLPMVIIRAQHGDVVVHIGIIEQVIDIVLSHAGGTANALRGKKDIDDKDLLTWTTVWQLRRRTGKPARPDSIRTLGPEQMTGISEGLIAH